MSSQLPNNPQPWMSTFSPTSKRRVVLGIDNGVDGAISVLDFDTKEAIELLDIPSRHTEWGMREIDPFLLQKEIERLQEMYHIVRAVIERLAKQGGKKGKMGYTAILSMGCSQGIVLAVLELCAITIRWILSEEWKPSVVGRGAHKSVSRTVALQRFPNMRDKLDMVKHHNRAEALLIGAYELE